MGETMNLNKEYELNTNRLMRDKEIGKCFDIINEGDISLIPVLPTFYIFDIAHTWDELKESGLGHTPSRDLLNLLYKYYGFGEYARKSSIQFEISKRIKERCFSAGMSLYTLKKHLKLLRGSLKGVYPKREYLVTFSEACKIFYALSYIGPDEVNANAARIREKLCFDILTKKNFLLQGFIVGDSKPQRMDSFVFTDDVMQQMSYAYVKVDSLFFLRILKELSDASTGYWDKISTANKKQYHAADVFLRPILQSLLNYRVSYKTELDEPSTWPEKILAQSFEE